MKPRMDGTLAAVDAPSSSLVAPRIGNCVDRPGEHDGDPAEDRSVEHHPVMAEPVGQDPEDGREDELGDVERGGEHADDGRVHPRTAVLGRSAR